MLQRRDYGQKRNPWTTWIAILVALVVGGVLLLALQAAFQVGDDMLRSIDETRPLSRPRPREGGYVRAHVPRTEVPAEAVTPAGPPDAGTRPGVVPKAEPGTGLPDPR